MNKDFEEFENFGDNQEKNNDIEGFGKTELKLDLSDFGNAPETEFEIREAGEYEATIENIEVTKSKAGNAMVKMTIYFPKGGKEWVYYNIGHPKVMTNKTTGEEYTFGSSEQKKFVTDIAKFAFRTENDDYEALRKDIAANSGKYIEKMIGREIDVKITLSTSVDNNGNPYRNISIKPL